MTWRKRTFEEFFPEIVLQRTYSGYDILSRCLNSVDIIRPADDSAVLTFLSVYYYQGFIIVTHNLIFLHAVI